MKQKALWMLPTSVLVAYFLVCPCNADEPKHTDVKAKPDSKVVNKQQNSKGRQTKAPSKSKSADEVKADNKKMPTDGAAIFKQYCASCHLGGGNSVKPSLPVAESKKVSNIGIFKDYLSDPPGHMPYYENLVNDKKSLEALFKYCNSLKRKPIKQASTDLKSSGKI